MRTILFRGKRVDNGDWVEGFYIQIMSFGNEYHCIFEAPNIDSFNDLNDYKVIPETVGQFTGLLDKNGTKIFEGDILEGISNNVFDNGSVSNYEVMWGIDHWHINGAHFTLQELFNYCNNKIKVVGNIYETPKLYRRRS